MTVVDQLLVDRRELQAKIGVQAQTLLPAIYDHVAPGTQFSVGWVHMEPGATSKAHLHANSDIAIVVLHGYALTLTGPDLTPVHHRPGQVVWLRRGLIHAAVNLSDALPVGGLEIRGDTKFNQDTQLRPDLDRDVASRARTLQAEHADHLRGRRDLGQINASKS